MRIVGDSNDGKLVAQPIDIQSASGIDVLQNVVEDTSPQLGEDLDVNGKKITSVTNGNIDIEPHGTGNVLLGNFTFDADATVGASQDNFILRYDNSTGLISLEAETAYADANAIAAVEGESTLDLTGTLTATDISITDSITLTKTDNGATAGPDLILNRTSSSPNDDDLLGIIKFQGDNASGADKVYASITGRIGRENAGSERGLINFNALDNGSDQLIMSMSRKGLFMGAGHVVALGGDSANFFTSLYVVDPTANRTITFPDATGTVVLTDTTDTLTNKTLTNPVISQIVSVSNGNIELDPNGTGKIVLDAITNINGNRTAASLFIDTNMSSDLTDDLANAIECQLDYTGSTIGSNTRQQSIVFKFKDDAVDLQAGRFTSEFTSADTTSNKMKLIAIDNSSSSPVNGQIHISPKQGSVNVPWELKSYTVADLPTAGIGAGAMAYVTNDAGGAVPCFYDGSAWRRVTDRAVCST